MSFRGTCAVALCLSTSGLTAFGAAQAQTTTTQPGATSAVSLATWSGPKTDSASDIVITLPSVTVSGAPRSFQVVSIPIPEAFAHVMKLEVEIVPHGDFALLGPRNRLLPVAQRSRVGVTIGIPATALAGRIVAAEARFSSPASPTLVVDNSFTIKTSDPQRAFDPTASIVDRAIYDTLFTYKGGDLTTPIPLLVQYGFAYSSNMMDRLSPYLHPAVGGRAIVEIPVSWVLDDAPYFMFSGQRSIQPPGPVLQGWLTEFEGITEARGVTNFTFHPQIIGRPSRLACLRELMDHVRHTPRMWIASLGEISAHYRTSVESAAGGPG